LKFVSAQQTPPHPEEQPKAAFEGFAALFVHALASAQRAGWAREGNRRMIRDAHFP
jgi:hypothetical protein